MVEFCDYQLNFASGFLHMPLLSRFDQAEIYHASAVAILQAFVPHGSRAKFAAELGISKQYLSSVSHVGYDAPIVLPSPELVETMATRLPAPVQYGHELREYLEEARLSLDGGKRELLQSCRSASALKTTIDEIRRAYNQAHFSQDPDVSRRRYQHVVAIGTQVLDQLSAGTYPLEFLEVCSPLVHASYALDRSGLGIFWAKLGTRIAEELIQDRSRFPHVDDRERLRRLHFLMSRDEAMGYHNLNQPQLALQRYERLQVTLATHSQKNDWSADLQRNSILSLSLLPRFAVGEVRARADAAGDYFAGKGDLLSALMNQEGLARALITYGKPLNLRRAEAILHSLLKQVERSPSAGPMHRATILVTAARLYWVQGDLENWKLLLLQAINLAEQAGLVRLRRKISEQYGDVSSLK